MRRIFLYSEIETFLPDKLSDNSIVVFRDSRNIENGVVLKQAEKYYYKNSNGSDPSAHLDNALNGLEIYANRIMNDPSLNQLDIIAEMDTIDVNEIDFVNYKFSKHDPEFIIQYIIRSKNNYVDELVIPEQLNDFLQGRDRIRKMLQEVNVQSSFFELLSPDDLKLYHIFVNDWKIACAYCIATMSKVENGVRLRPVQILAVILAFLQDVNTFFEIKTGEGKTYVIAVIAAVNALLGKNVQIATSTDVLAEENHVEMEPFFKQLELTSGLVTNPEAQLNHVIYGSLCDFQFEYLRICCERKEPFEPRQICIIDEFDLLAIDYLQHTAKLGHPSPGMEKIFKQHRTLIEIPELQEVPLHLKDYCEKMLPNWDSIKEHIFSYNSDFLNVYYEIDKDNNNQKRLVPLDSRNTGMLMRRSAFADGWQQLLELRNKCKLTVEIMTSYSISNWGYFEKFKKVLGFTGTLGGTIESDLLRKMFDSSSVYHRIPPHHSGELFTEKAMQSDYNVVETDLVGRIKLNINHYTSLDEYTIKLIEIKVTSRPMRILLKDYCGFVFNSNVKDNFQCSIFWDKFFESFKYPSEESYNKQVLICIKRMIKKYGDNKNYYIIVDNNIENYLNEIEMELHILNKSECEQHEPQPNDVFFYVFKISFENDTEEKDMNSILFTFTDHIEGFKIIMNEPQKEILVLDRGMFDFNCFSLIENIPQYVALRAILVVCQNTYIVKKIEKHLKKLIFDRIRIYTYTHDMDSVNRFNIRNNIEVGDVILTTNIGGRGADFKVSKELAANGGLHVIVTFLPENPRIEQQAYGRAARNGTPGSGQLVLEDNYVKKWLKSRNIRKKNINNIEQFLKTKREDLYVESMVNLQEKKLMEIAFHDQLHKKFNEFCNKFSQNNNENLINDLVDYWSVWLKLKREDISEMQGTPEERATKVFEIFDKDSKYIHTDKKFFNPCYAVARAVDLLLENKISEAEELIRSTYPNGESVMFDALANEYARFAINACMINDCMQLVRNDIYKWLPIEIQASVNEHISQAKRKHDTMEQIESNRKVILTFVFDKCGDLQFRPLSGTWGPIVVLSGAFGTAYKKDDISKLGENIVNGWQSARDPKRTSVETCVNYLIKEGFLLIGGLIPAIQPLIKWGYEKISKHFENNPSSIQPYEIIFHDMLKKKLHEIIENEIKNETKVSLTQLFKILNGYKDTIESKTINILELLRDKIRSEENFKAILESDVNDIAEQIRGLCRYINEEIDKYTEEHDDNQSNKLRNVLTIVLDTLISNLTVSVMHNNWSQRQQREHSQNCILNLSGPEEPKLNRDVILERTESYSDDDRNEDEEERSSYEMEIFSRCREEH